ncbi:MAG: IS5 family transposase [Candidatus Thiodiazotropha sp. (ex. Lucinisca nassula)]|nr:IS5 family transposase [Candidatus Thiodiazotropha sp. (ex. Lucinisca nassula)]MBW9275196.1 IS5 family transposase [Candidatus Thiodiazotropha sp. (ex. Lucinisca nassula)]
MNQSSFADLEYSHKKKTTRREKFLQEMEAVIPWQLLVKTIKRAYPQGHTGRPPVKLEVLLRIYFLQQWYGLSDPAAEDSLYDTESMRRFVGVDLAGIPDESTICRFRHRLEKEGLTAKLFHKVEAYLSDKGLIVSEGTIVDATIVSAPSSTKNREKKRDPEMKQTKKGNQWHFGMKAHVGTDTEGRVHSVVVTDACVHDSQIMDDLLHGEEQSVYGDKAYANAEKRDRAEANGVEWRVNRKARRGKKLNCADRAFNKKSNRTRAKGEHAFRIVKDLWGYSKVRYKGLEKNAAQVFSLFALANLYLCRKDLLALQG